MEAKEACEDEIKLAHAEEAAAKLEADGKQLGILIPYFRSMNTDINSPLSIAIWAMIFIEFWGITALGVFKYAGKFFVTVSAARSALFVGSWSSSRSSRASSASRSGSSATCSRARSCCW